MIDQPRNPRIKIASPLLTKNGRPEGEASGSKAAANELAGQIASALRDADAGYVLQLESEEDFNDVDSILLGLRLRGDLLDSFPSFNTWQSNPLFGIDRENIDLLLKSHRFGLPRWLREEIDVETRLMSFGQPRGDISEFVPMIALGFPNFATHLALLSTASTAKIVLEGQVTLHPDNSVELLLTGRKSKGRTLVFLSTVDHSDTSSNFHLDLMRKAARRNELITLAIPSTADSFASTFPADMVIDFRKPFDPKKFALLPVRVVDLADSVASAKGGDEASKSPDAAIWDDIVRAA